MDRKVIRNLGNPPAMKFEVGPAHVDYDGCPCPTYRQSANWPVSEHRLYEEK